MKWPQGKCASLDSHILLRVLHENYTIFAPIFDQVLYSSIPRVFIYRSLEENPVYFLLFLSSRLRNWDRRRQSQVGIRYTLFRSACVYNVFQTHKKWRNWKVPFTVIPCLLIVRATYSSSSSLSVADSVVNGALQEQKNFFLSYQLLV